MNFKEKYEKYNDLIQTKIEVENSIEALNQFLGRDSVRPIKMSIEGHGLVFRDSEDLNFLRSFVGERLNGALRKLTQIKMDIANLENGV